MLNFVFKESLRKDMQTVLFHSTIFGPIRSRRLGVSLGVNLTPDDGKICTFDCLYCEAGFNAQGPGTTGFAPRERVARLLESRLRNMSEAGEPDRGREVWYSHDSLSGSGAGDRRVA